MRREIYPRLDSEKVFHSQTYFKDEINIISDVLFRNTTPESFADTFGKKLKNISQDTVLFCEFGLSGNPLVPGVDYESFYERTDFFAKVFPDAVIIIILRNQIDWFISLYRNVIRNGSSISIDEFLNFENRKFVRGPCQKMNRIDALSFDFSAICKYYVKLFGDENVHFFFYEDLKIDPEDFIKKLQDVIGADLSEEIRLRAVNRGFSAFALTATRLKNKIFRRTRADDRESVIRRYLLVAPVYMLEKYDIPNRPFGLAIKEVSPGKIPAIFLRRVLIKIGQFFTWPSFVQHFLDKIFYLDWDILGEEKRNLLRAHYAKVNEGLLPFFKNEKAKKYYLYDS
jgi:hypothetical protein